MIRAVTPGDLWTLRRKPRSVVWLYNEAMLAQPHRLLWCALRCLLEGSGRDVATFVYRERGMRAAIQSVGRSGRPEQDIVVMSAYGGGPGHPTDPDVWFRLMERLCIHAGHHRVQRLYAALSQRHEELREVFRQLGFIGYTHQTVLRLEGPDWDQGITLAPMRVQARRDDWAIHRLYGTTTPYLVQQAEARVARDWRLPLTQGWRRPRRRGWVLGPDDNLHASLHLTSGPAAHVLTLLIHADVRDIVTDVLRFGLGQISDTLPVYLLLREYQSELLAPAGDLGFQPIGEQALLFKSTTVAVRRPSLIPALEPIPEPRAPIPTISSISDNTRQYDRATRHHE
jgi:hypothetical protein